MTGKRWGKNPKAKQSAHWLKPLHCSKQTHHRLVTMFLSLVSPEEECVAGKLVCFNVSAVWLHKPHKQPLVWRSLHICYSPCINELTCLKEKVKEEVRMTLNRNDAVLKNSRKSKINGLLVKQTKMENLYKCWLRLF